MGYLLAEPVIVGTTTTGPPRAQSATSKGILASVTPRRAGDDACHG